MHLAEFINYPTLVILLLKTPTSTFRFLLNDQRDAHLFSVYLFIFLAVYMFRVGARGGVVVKALRYKPAGRGFDPRWCHWNFSVT